MQNFRKLLSVRLGLLVVVWLGVLFFGLAGCNATLAFQHSDPLPKLLKVIELPEEIATERIAVIPGGYTYALNDATNSIAVLDGPKLVTLMRMGKRYDKMYLRDIAVHPQTGLLYVTDSANNTVYVISKTQVITTITQPGIDWSPQKIVIHPKTGYVYISDARLDPSLQGGVTSEVVVISGTHIITSVAVGKGIQVLQPDPDTNRIYVGQSLLSHYPGTSMVAVLDGTHLIMTSTLGYEPTAIEADYQINGITINQHTGEISLLENENNVIHWHGDRLERIHLGKDYGFGPLTTIGLDPKRDILYAGVLQSPYAVALVKNQAPVQLRMVAGSHRIVYDATHDYIYTADYNGPSLSVIRGTTVLASLSTGGDGPYDIGVDEQRGYIYVSNADSHSVAVFGFDQPVAKPALWQTFLPWLGK
ncbi:MAG: hypothetical protein NT075_37275 [Chloroflexi bacterium]|nr:hypothetical protein [Chloroflexota bacterium]